MRKIICFIISIMILGQLYTVNAEDSTSHVVPDSPDMVFATSLGILSSGTDQSAPFTRAELASVFYNIILPGASPVFVKSKYFSDVGIGTAPYADFVYDCGIMNGVGEASFAPDMEVTYAQLIKTVIAFLGYTYQAESKGGYPYGYISVASNLGITSQAPLSADSIITANMVASVFRLASAVPLMKTVSYGNSERFEEDENSNYLEKYMKITSMRGVVTGNFLTDFDSYILDYNQVKIDNQIFYITNESKNIINNIGYMVDVYYKETQTDNNAEIVYYEITNKNDEKTITGEDITALRGGQLVYDGSKKLWLSADAKCIYNGTYTPSYDESIINPFKYNNLEGKVQLVDNNSDGKYEIIIVDAYSSYVVSNVADNVIFNEFLPGETVDLGMDFKEGDVEIVNVFGEPLAFSEIEKGDVINVSRDLDGKIKRIVVTIDKYSGVIKGISEKTINVDENEFEMSGFMINNPQSDYSKIKPGLNATLYFNKDGKVSDIKVSTDNYKIGYAVSFGNENDQWMLRIFTSEGNFEYLTLAKKVRISDSSGILAEKAIGNLMESGKLVRQPILYKVNEKNEINWIDYAYGITPRDGLYIKEGFDGTSKSIHYRSGQKNFGGELLIGDNTVIFNVPKDDNATDWTNYYIEDNSYYSDGSQTIDFTAYGITEKNSPCAAVIVEKDGQKGIQALTDSFVVDTVTEVVDESNECKIQIKGFTYSGMTSYLAEKSLMNEVFGDSYPVKGDVIRIRGVDREAKTIRKVFDFKNETFQAGSNPTSANYYTSFRCMYGEVTYNDGTYIKIRPYGSDREEAYPVSNFKIVEIDYSFDSKGIMRAATASKIFDTEKYPGYASKVFIHTRNGDARTMVIYNGLER